MGHIKGDTRSLDHGSCIPLYGCLYSLPHSPLSTSRMTCARNGRLTPAAPMAARELLRLLSEITLAGCNK